MKKTAFVTSLFLLSLQANAELTGQARSLYTDGFIKHCQKNMVGTFISDGYGAKGVVKFCQCAATYFADRITVGQANKWASGIEKPSPEMNSAATNFCHLKLMGL